MNIPSPAHEGHGEGLSLTGEAKDVSDLDAAREQRWNERQLAEPVLHPRMKVWTYREGAIVLGRSQHALAEGLAAAGMSGAPSGDAASMPPDGLADSGAVRLPLVKRGAGGGAVLAFIAFFVACAALARAKPKAPAALLVLASLFLPLAATAAGVYYGAGVLKEQTVAEAQNFAGQIKVGNIDQVLSSLQSGVSFPGREDIISVLNTVKDKAAEQGIDPQGGADQSGDQQGDSQDGAGQDDGGGQQDGAQDQGGSEQ